MNLHLRWQALLAFVCLALILTLLTFQAQTAGLCIAQAPAQGGVFVEGIVGAPQRLNPLLSDFNLVDQELVNLLFDGLTRYDEDGRLVPHLARDWTVSEDGLSVAFELRDDVFWHDGSSFSAEDVAFTYGLLQEEAFPAPAGLKTLWASIAITVTGSSEISFGLPESYAPFMEATTRGILPAHLLADVPPEELADHPFNERPIGVGPFMMAPGSNWRETGRLRLLPAPAYWPAAFGPDGLEFRFYPDEASLLDAFAAGEVQAINSVSAALFPQAASLPGIRFWTTPAPRYTQLLFNLGETGAPALRSIEVRRAMAHALDRQTLLDETLHGQGMPLAGPYLPTSWAYNPGLLNVYSHSQITATTLLDDAGWLLAEGADTRRRDEAELTLRLLVADNGVYPALAEAVAAQWRAVGIGSQVIAAPPLALPELLAAGEFDVALVEIEPPGDPDLYDFWSQEAIVRGQNYANWNHRRASEALEAGRQLWSVEERRPYYDAFLRFYNSELPAITLYQHVYTYAVSEAVYEVEIGPITQPRDRYKTMPAWYWLYREVTVACPEEPETGNGKRET